MKNFDQLKFIETVSIEAVRATYHLRMRVSPMRTQLIYVFTARMTYRVSMGNDANSVEFLHR